jgi:hypothetical protein
MGPGNGGFRLEATLIGNGSQQGAIGRIGDGKTGAARGAPGAILPVAEGLQQRRYGCMKHNKTPLENGAIGYGMTVIIGPLESGINQNPSMFGLRK